MTYDDIMTISAIVAAYVGVVKSFGINAKWNPLIALVISTGIVLIPTNWQEKVILISIIALSASGLYQHAKNKGSGSQ